MYSVRVTAQVAQNITSGEGTRKRRCTIGGKSVVLTFSRTPVLLAVLPPEVASDPYLLVEETPGEAPTAAPQAAPETAAPDVVIPVDLAGLKYQDLKKLAAALKLDVSGKQAELIERIEAARDARIVVDED